MFKALDVKVQGQGSKGRISKCKVKVQGQDQSSRPRLKRFKTPDVKGQGQKVQGQKVQVQGQKVQGQKVQGQSSGLGQCSRSRSKFKREDATGSRSKFQVNFKVQKGGCNRFKIKVPGQGSKGQGSKGQDSKGQG